MERIVGNIFSWAPPDADAITVEVACDFHDWELGFRRALEANAPAELRGHNFEADEGPFHVPLDGAATVRAHEDVLEIEVQPDVATRIGCPTHLEITPTDEADWTDAKLRLAYVLDPAANPLPEHLGPRTHSPRRGILGRILGR